MHLQLFPLDEQTCHLNLASCEWFGGKYGELEGMGSPTPPSWLMAEKSEKSEKCGFKHGESVVSSICVFGQVVFTDHSGGGAGGTTGILRV
jgi:hypothetical protein